MLVEERLQNIARELRAGESPPPYTVREFLSWFDAQRRGYWIVKSIRDHLSNAGLRTEPDFESAYIDSDISLRLASAERSHDRTAETPIAFDGVSTTQTQDALSMSEVPPLLYTDPTYRISKLAAANNQPYYVRPNTSIQEVITVMLSRDFSQIPVMTSEREVKGVISWISIGSRLALGRKGSCAQDLMDSPHQEIRADASLFQAIPIIVQHQYVLIRDNSFRIVGMVTSYDLNIQFQDRTEPFLLLADIENHIRNIIGTKFSKEDLARARDPADPNRTVDGVHDLAFAEYIRLLENPDRWIQLGLPIDRATFCKELDSIRRVRNDVMHFDPDGIPPNDLEALRKFANFLYKLQNMGVT